MALNVSKYATFGAGNRALRSNDPCPKCGVEKTAQRAMPDCGFSTPEAHKVGGAHTVCYVPFVGNMPNYIVKHIDDKMKRAQWFLQENDRGEYRLISGAVAGNKVSAWRTDQRTDDIFKAVKWEKEKTLFITLTHQYIKTEKGREESWQFYQKDLPRFIRKLRAKGMKDYIVVKEAHRDGGCHAHLLCQWERNFLMFKYKNKYRLANTAMREYIKDNWAGDVDIEGIRDDQIKGYIKKYLGKYSHIEDALRRAKREWLKEGDEKHKDTDCKKLWTNYYCDKLKIRRFTSNIKKLESETQGDSPADLVKNMNNTTEENKPKVTNLWLLPWHIKYNLAFTPYNGKIDPNDRVYSLMMNYIRGKKNGT